MKCANHPQYEAVALCPRCGKHICNYCSVNIFNMPHCKECTQDLVLHMSRLPKGRFRKQLPRRRRLKAMKRANPTGRLNRNFFILGGVGSLIIAIAAFLLGWSFSLPRHESFGSYPSWLILYGLLFAIGLAITGFGFYGFYRNYGALWGLITCTVLEISAFLVSILIIISILEPQGWDWDEALYRLEFWFGFALLVIGFCMVLMGGMFLYVRNLTGEITLSMFAGILNIIGSLLFFTIFPASTSGFAWFGLCTSSMIMGVVFLHARLHAGRKTRFIVEGT